MMGEMMGRAGCGVLTYLLCFNTEISVSCGSTLTLERVVWSS